jgi:cell division transport system permease protein
MVSRSLYFTGKALGAMRMAPGVSLLTTATIGVALLVLGIYTMAVTDLEGLALVWGRSSSITVYLKDGVPEGSWEAARRQVQAMQGVAQVQIVRPEEALAHFRARGAEAAALVAGISPSVLPASLEIHLAATFTDLGSIESLARSIEKLEGVVEVDYGREEFERLRGLLTLLRYGGLIGGLLLALATAFIIGNTIRLAVYSQQDEIAILRLVGATAWFIRAPFIIQGALWGLVGSALAAGLLWLADRALAPQLAAALVEVLGGLPIRFYATEVAGGILVAGILLGSVGSALAVRRFLEAEI